MADGDITALQILGDGAMLKHGYVAKSLGSDANYTATVSEYIYQIQKYTSSVNLTATRNIVLPLTAGALIFVWNATSGSQSLQFLGASGTGITIANAKGAWLFCDGTNWNRASADVTP